MNNKYKLIVTEHELTIIQAALKTCKITYSMPTYLYNDLDNLLKKLYVQENIQNNVRK